MKVDCASFYPQTKSKVLILRAPNGLLSQEDLLLPEEVVGEMIRKIPDVKRFDVGGTNHYGIIFQPHEARDRAIMQFRRTNIFRNGCPNF